MIVVHPMALHGAEVGAWVAAIAGGIALGKQIYDGVRSRRKEVKEIDEALDKAPEVRKQLEIGNIGEAVKHLNSIIESQSSYANRLAEENSHLRNQLQAAEAESDGWERKFEESEAARRRDQTRYEGEIARISAQAEADKRGFARALAQIRREEGGK